MVMYKLSKKGSLRKNKNFQAVYKAGRSFANKMIVLYILPKSGDDRRIGFAAGKRLGNAVVRNRMKRLLRETYRLNQTRLISGVDLVLVARKVMVEADLSAVTRSFLDLCKKARILVK